MKLANPIWNKGINPITMCRLNTGMALEAKIKYHGKKKKQESAWSMKN